jgi:SAM-dependent methyltransferase
VSGRDFAPVAASLRESVLEFYRARGESLDGPAGQNTLATNSSFVERRGRPLLGILRESAGIDSLEGLRLVDLGAGFGALALYFAFHGAKVVAVDPNAGRFSVGREVAERHGLEVRFKRGGMQRLRLSDERFHLAVQNNSFCYIVSPEERRKALLETLRVLRSGGWLVARNPNRWNPLDQFTGLPLLHLLPPEAAVRAAALLRRKRSLVKLTSPPAAAVELRTAGFVEVAQSEPGEYTRLDPLKLFARYHHFTARRPNRAVGE